MQALINPGRTPQHRDGLRRIACVIALAVVAMFPAKVFAITMGQCAAQYNAYLEAQNIYYEGEVPDEEQTDLLTTGAINLQWINSLDDVEDLAESLEVWREPREYSSDDSAEWRRYRDAWRAVIVCMYEERIAELRAQGGGDEEASTSAQAEDEAEPEPERVYSDNRESAAEPLNKSQWFVEAEYPVSAMREERQGVVSYDLTIGVDGKVLGCQASGPPNSADLEMATCEAILARARFEPATDASGSKVVGEYSGTITWNLPE